MKNLIVIRINEVFLKAIHEKEGKFTCVADPRDAYHWNDKNKALATAEWLVNVMGGTVRVFVETYAQSDNGKVELK